MQLNQIQFKKKFRDAFFLHFEQQKPIVRVFRTGFAEKGTGFVIRLSFFDKGTHIGCRFFKAVSATNSIG